MTAEIAILNRQCVALAADSAVTIGRDRVWKTANKLFSLGPAHDIGIMLHGSADYLGFSWETIIKLFRKECQNQAFNTVADCAAAFVNFVNSNHFRNDRLEEYSIAVQFLDLLTTASSSLEYDSKLDFRKKIVAGMSTICERLEDDDVYDNNLTLSSFTEEWESVIKNLAEDAFGEVITKAVLQSITKALYQYTRRKIASDYSTGIVVAGFGSNEMMPAVHSYIFDGRCDGIMRCWPDQHSNLNADTSANAVVIPFGQADIIYMIMEGVLPESVDFATQFLSRSLDGRSDELIKHYVRDPEEAIVERALQSKANEGIIAGFVDEFTSFRRKTSVDPIISVIRSLPREEMASMAEALIDITSLRRRVDSDVESVGGPVDVAVISKGDGFIWMKRKHYFNIDLNQDFLYRKHKLGAKS